MDEFKKKCEKRCAEKKGKCARVFEKRRWP